MFGGVALLTVFTAVTLMSGEAEALTTTPHNSWTGGLTADLKIKLCSETDGWTVRLTFNKPVDITQMWSGSYKKESDTEYEVTNVGYNKKLNSGQFITFGFEATKNGNDNVKITATLDGDAACSDDDSTDAVTGTKNKLASLTLNTIQLGDNIITLSGSVKNLTAMTCAQRKQKILQDSNNGMPLLGQFIPTCASDGSYASKQCHGSVCYCADATGNKILDYIGPIYDATMDCQCARDQYTYMQTRLIGKMFICTSSGNYQRYQCSGSVCFCADNLGNMKPGSPSVNIGNIDSLNC